jgi:hypothetical protein
LAHALLSGLEFGLAFYCYLAFVNWCAFSISYRELTATAAVVCAGRELDMPLYAGLMVVWACMVKLVWIHGIFGAILAFAALLAPVPFFVYGAISLFDLFRDFLQINSVFRALGYLMVGLLHVVLVFCGAMASVQSTPLAIGFWTLLVVAAYFNTDISHWIMRPKTVTMRSLKRKS